MKIDLLDTIEQGGCSAKLSAKELDIALAGLEIPVNENLLVDIETHDDGGVYKITDDYALIQTTDFFPPVCSDPYDFGQIAAANALSDVYAMGGEVLTAMNLLMFPPELPMSILKKILEGGHDKIKEAGGVVIGGHTVADDIPKYGLAVTGKIHPKDITTNASAESGDILILTKPIGVGVAISAMKNKLGTQETYDDALFNMKQLNKAGAEVMRKYNIKCATDITGFGLLGHGMKMALGSKKTLEIDSSKVPVIEGVNNLIEMGCIPGAAFRNLEYIEDKCIFAENLDYNTKMLLNDAQSSGGLLMCVKPESVINVIEDLITSGFLKTCIIGEVIDKTDKAVIVN